jgi:putative ABC transport system permease protein
MSEPRSMDPNLWLRDLWQDVRYALRAARRAPAFTAAAVLTLGLGIGANAAMFGLVDAVLLHPLPFADPDRLVALWEKPPHFDHNTISPLTFLDWRDQAESFEDLAGVRSASMVITGGRDPEQVPAQAVSSSFFRILRVAPALGRGFTPEDETPGHEKVAILSDSLRKRRFGGSPGVIGTEVTLEGERYTAIGVLPPRFRLAGDCDVWVPLALRRETSRRDSHFLRAIGRLKPGVSLEAARSEMAAIAEGIARLSPETNRGWGVLARTLAEDLIGPDLRATSALLQCGVGLVLLVACANVASLLLVKGAGRTREMALRAVLGAGRGRIARQLLTESLLLSLAGACAGGWLAGLILDSAPSWLPAGTLPAVVQPALSWRTALFSLAAALVTGALCGLAPGWQAGRVNLQDTLRGGGRAGGGGDWTRRVLAAGEIAMAVVLVAGAALLFRTLQALERAERGYRADRVLTFRVSLPAGRYPTPETAREFQRRAIEALSAVPGAQAAALAYDLPLEGWSYGEQFQVVGREEGPAAGRPYAHLQGVSPRYFEALGIPLLRGRAFDESDDAGSDPVCIINEGLARAFFPDRSPLGTQAVRDNSPTGRCTIVGVSGQVKVESPGEGSLYELYVPYSQDSTAGVAYAIRTDVEPDALAQAVRAAMRRLDPELPLVGVRTMENVAADSVARPRFRAVLMGAFAGLAWTLALMGIYSVLAYAVTRRTREFGIRMALGAQASDVLWLVLRDGLRLTLAGVALGVITAMGTTRFLQAMLWGVRPLDPTTWIVAPALLIAAAAAACAIPARRATRVDPLSAIRYE